MHPCTTVLSNVPPLSALPAAASEKMITSLARAGTHLCISAVIHTVTAAATNRQQCTCTHTRACSGKPIMCVHVHRREDHPLAAVRTVAMITVSRFRWCCVCLMCYLVTEPQRICEDNFDPSQGVSADEQCTKHRHHRCDSDPSDEFRFQRDLQR